MKVVFADRARQDIADIYDTVSAHNKAAAHRVEAMIRDHCERLADFPYAAVAVDEPDMFRLPLVRYPYTIYYRVTPGSDLVEVARVIHASRVKNLNRLPQSD